MNTSRLTGRIVAITGAARGIGFATARALRERGAAVAIGDIDADLADEAAKSLGSDVVTAELDVTDAKSFTAFIDTAERELGPVDVLVNNAGIMPIGPVLEESHELAQRVLDVNVSGTLIGMKIALARMAERGTGHIVNLASVAGKSPVPGGMSYAASKAAIVSLTESARVEFAGSGVSFSCVLPSFTNTDLIAGTTGTKFVRTAEPAEVGAAITNAIAKRRPDVFVPSVLGPIIKTQPMLGRALRDRANAMLGAYDAFLGYDRGAREEYQARISGGARRSEPAKTSPRYGGGAAGKHTAKRSGSSAK